MSGALALAIALALAAWTVLGAAAARRWAARGGDGRGCLQVAFVMVFLVAAPALVVMGVGDAVGGGPSPRWMLACLATWLLAWLWGALALRALEGLQRFEAAHGPLPGMRATLLWTLAGLVLAILGGFLPGMAVVAGGAWLVFGPFGEGSLAERGGVGAVAAWIAALVTGGALGYVALLAAWRRWAARRVPPELLTEILGRSA